MRFLTTVAGIMTINYANYPRTFRNSPLLRLTEYLTNLSINKLGSPVLVVEKPNFGDWGLGFPIK